MKTKQKSKIKHIPVRTCIATGVKKPKTELMRLVRLSDGTVKVDPRSKLEGRGANITMSPEAFDLAVKKRALQRALKLEKPLTQEKISQLRQEFIEAIDERNFRPKGKPVTIRVKKEQLTNIEE